MVDDSTFEQCALGELLSRQGYRVLSAYDGRQGYDTASVAQPDLILLDLRMAGMDGFSTCRLLKANPATASIPVIFLSSDDRAEERIAGLTLGAVDFIGKPYSAGELIARIEVHLKLADKGEPDAAPEPVQDGDAVLAAAAIRLIEQHLDEPLNLDDIAKRVGSYREKLSRVFQEQKGVTVFAYIREARIQRAAELLRDSAAGISEIALAVGFSNPGNFATAFRERMGVTPGAYRRASKQDAGSD